MALRQIDNALPTTPDRPKKQVKVAIAIQKQPEMGVNDENRPPPVEVTIDYIRSEDLEPVSDPDLEFYSTIEGLESKDWVKVCESLNNVRRFALFHSSLLAPILEKVMEVMLKAMKNPRSALCKTSIMASSDIFKAFGDILLESPDSDAFDNLVLQLLLKASQDKKFVCEEASKALIVMVDSIPSPPLLQKLSLCVNHSNPRIRAKAAVVTALCVSKMGAEKVKKFGFDLLIKMGAALLNDRLPEAREAARSIVISVHTAFTASQDQDQAHEEEQQHEEDQKHEEEAWHNFCQTNLLPLDAQTIIKIVSSI